MARDRFEEREMNDDVAKDIEEALKERKQERAKAAAEKNRKKRRRTWLVLILAFVLMASLFGRDLVRLKVENRNLKKQQAELELKRDELKEELAKTGDKEYIREQARRQLRLMNPGEILFTFGDEEATEEEVPEDE